MRREKREERRGVVYENIVFPKSVFDFHENNSNTSSSASTYLSNNFSHSSYYMGNNIISDKFCYYCSSLTF